jgi:hypothetical protein
LKKCKCTFYAVIVNFRNLPWSLSASNNLKKLRSSEVNDSGLGGSGLKDKSKFFSKIPVLNSQNNRNASPKSLSLKSAEHKHSPSKLPVRRQLIGDDKPKLITLDQLKSAMPISQVPN